MTPSKTVLFLLLFMPITLLSQQTKKINKKEIGETFYVLKSDKKIKHGEYKKFNYAKKLIVNGYYNHGVADSIWECFGNDGTLTLKYDYKKNELLFYKPSNKYSYRVINNSSDTTLSRPPIYLYGDTYIVSEIFKNIRYPMSAFMDRASGKVEVMFTVDKSGRTDNFRVDNPIGSGLDEEAIRVLGLIPDNWLPGISNEQPVDVEVSYSITFKLRPTTYSHSYF